MKDGEITLGAHVKYYRKQRGFTLEQLAEKVDITLNYIQTIESGKDIPSIELLTKISNALQVQPRYLFLDEKLDLAVCTKFSHLPHSDIHLLTTILSAINTEMSSDKPTFKADVGKRIAEYRIRLKMPRKELASRMGITPAFLGNIENGMRSMTLKNLNAALNALDVPLEYILQDQSKDSNLLLLNDLLDRAKTEYSPKQYASIIQVVEELLLFSENG